ncbi:U4/U6.U5 tri-snRNP-associated protein 1-like isoform X2 [Patiria miniata]|uniref:U4/U6.U5 tri-snRNP-associated protein 1 n=1 Tax=Patiria miniata TaxID=46514 RepID=A0A914B8T1_PATMI|nr:U4/U6.U5 tri-snRNP-associated protein 1-like isoform X2 [Patiria miniata]
MGSSKKHKDRDRDEKRHKHKRDKDRDADERKEHREKKRHKHRHRSRSPRDDIGEADKRDRHDRKKKHRHDKRDRSSSPSEDGGRAGPVPDTFVDEVFQLVKEEIDGESKKKIAPSSAGASGGSVKVEKDQEPISEKTGSGYVESLSIAETNKIRAKLGLPPLKVDGNASQPTAEGGDGAKKEGEDVHKPAVNLGEKRKAEEIKAKLALIKEKRKINQKLQKVKKIAQQEEDLDDVTAWVERSRKNQLERDMAAKRAKMLEEMDEEFGIGTLVENEFAPKKDEAYSSKHIRDLKVLHSVGSFKEGKNVILTLKDADVLGEDEDELMNVNILDDEKAAKNVELRKKKKDYRPYEGDTIDEYGIMKPRDVLTKYDEEIEGAKIESFRLGDSASYDDEEKCLERIRANLQAQAVSLDFKAPTLASEYYTPAEMEAFKKPKKKKFKRKIKKKFTVDDLTPDDADASDDHGSRGRMRRRPAEDSITDNGEAPSVEGLDGDQQPMDMDLDLPDVEQSDIMGPDEEDDLYSGPPIEDEAEQELQMVLSKARKLKQKKSKTQAKVEEKIAEEVAKIQQEPMDAESTAPSIALPLIGSSSGASKGINITLNSTSEFCRTLGEIPTYGLAGNREEDEDEILDYERERQEMEDLGDEAGQEGWSTVNLEQEEDTYTGDVAGPVLEEEPTVQMGIAGALNLAVKKGYIEQEFIKAVPKSKNVEDLEAKNFTVEDKNYNDIDAKYNKHDRYRGPLADFKEKEGYKPDVQLKYVDDNGRDINQKEAFRQLSHRFHGKGSGKMKTDKRAKKQMEIEAMKKMSSTDTPLNTVAMMKQKQKQTQSPFILLSGGSKSLTANTLAK